MDETHFNLLQQVNRLHFVGIGGSGMCPLAEILHSQGYTLTGSDNNETDTLARIRGYGIPVALGHAAENIGNAQAVVYSAAIMQDNPELVAARDKGLPLIERSVLLGLIARHYQNTVAVSGTHGKTTVTSMITQILVDANLDPTIVIGGKFNHIGGNGRAGKSDIMVCEACEFVDTFLELTPAVSVILNIDEDHLDYFKTLDNIIHSFRRFATQTSRTLVVNGDDENSMKAVEGLDKELITFGRGTANHYRAEHLTTLSGARTKFTLYHHQEPLTEIVLNIPGHHHVYNALAAAATAHSMGVPPDRIAQSLSDFVGAARRFEILGRPGGIVIADDYAHHPKELKVTLQAASEMGFRKVWAVFQPFTYSRTALLLDDFADALRIADKVVMTEIMGAREINTYDIYTKDLADKIEGSVWYDTFDEVADHIVKNAEPGDLVITMGCGDIYKAAKLMLQKYADSGYPAS